MYSQNNEETIITEFFGPKALRGRFLDIGAYDGKTFSNTRRLAELGWGGVVVEPSPSVMPALLALYGSSEFIEIVNAAVCPDVVYERTGGLVNFFDSSGDAISTTSTAHRDRWSSQAQSKFNKFRLHLLPVTRLLVEVGFNFDFVNIDVEATNLDLFTGMPWGKMDRVKMICVEHDGQHKAMELHAANFGFKQHAFNGENLILIR